MRGHIRGHLVEWDEAAHIWRYVDDNQPAEGWGGVPRPCPQCQELPAEDGHDPCIRSIPGATGACCGHGVHVGYVTWPGIPAPPGWCQRAFIVEE